jgi:hypothetical protein
MTVTKSLLWLLDGTASRNLRPASVYASLAQTLQANCLQLETRIEWNFHSSAQPAAIRGETNNLVLQRACIMYFW